VGLIEKWGKFDREAHAGLNFVMCCLGEHMAGTVSHRVQAFDVKVETKTKDNVFVDIDISVQYQALPGKSYEAWYRLVDSEQQIKAYVYDVVRASVPKITLDDVFTTKGQIAEEVKSELSHAMEEYGFMIVKTLITDITPDTMVRAAMNDINEAKRLRDAATDKAEADKIMIVKAAEAEAESRYLAGVGVARQRLAIIEGLRDSVLGFTENISGASAKDVMDLVLMTQYFDTLKDIGAKHKTSTVFMPHGDGDGIANQIRNGAMMAAPLERKMK